MTVFKFALQKEFLISTELLDQEAFLNQISMLGCLVYDNKGELKKAVGSTPELSKLWTKVFRGNLIRVKQQTDYLLEGVQDTKDVEEYLKNEMLSVAVLEDDTAQVLLEAHNHLLKTDKENKEMCHRAKIVETQAFQEALSLRSKPIMEGDKQMEVWKSRYLPILEDSSKINIVDRHFLQQALGGIERTGPKKILNNLSLLKNLTEVNIYCETPKKEDKKEDGRTVYVQYEENELKERIINEVVPNKNLEVNFYIGGEYHLERKRNNKKGIIKSILGSYGKGSYLQSFGYVKEVITSDHLSEIFNDEAGSKGAVSSGKTFGVHKYNEDGDKKPIEKLNRLITQEFGKTKRYGLNSFIFRFGSKS